MGVIVLHTSESGAGSTQAVASYLLRTGNRSHLIFDPASGERLQLVPWDWAAASLRNLPGGVETNNRGDVFQVEIIGRAADVGSYSETWFLTLADALRGWCAETGTPLVFPCPFLPYPQSYGANGVRLSPEAWLTVEGVVGHQHVPENDHGDPGNLTRLVDLLQPPQGPPAMPAIEPTTKVTVNGASYNLIDVLGWALEGINALRAAAPAAGTCSCPTAAQVADELAKRLAS